MLGARTSCSERGTAKASVAPERSDSCGAAKSTSSRASGKSSAFEIGSSRRAGRKLQAQVEGARIDDGGEPVIRRQRQRQRVLRRGEEREYGARSVLLGQPPASWIEAGAAGNADLAADQPLHLGRDLDARQTSPTQRRSGPHGDSKTRSSA